MAASKSDNFVKDALILFLITLVAGICLGFVYDITKAPIEAATVESNNSTYKAVLSSAEKFSDVDGSADKIAATADEIAGLGYGGVAIESVLEGKDASGKVVGHVINSLSNDSYGGAVKISVGFDMDGNIVGLGIREISDTPGLGLKAQEPDFTNQYIGKNADKLSVTKSGNAGDTEINAISGATITSNAVTNAVNAALYYLHNEMN